MLSQKNMIITIGLLSIAVESASLNIEDSREVKLQNGIPVGELDGPVSASGELVVDARNRKIISGAAAIAGSYKQLPAFDINFYAKNGDEQSSVVAYGCKLMISSLVDAKPNETGDMVTTIPFNVTSPDFVDIDGIPYINQDELTTLIPAIKGLFLAL